MALIECKACGKPVSDKTKICPHCGEVLISESIPEPLKCSECGFEIPNGAETCPNCGCPVELLEETVPQKVEVTKVSMQVNKNKVLKIVGISIALIVAALISIFAIKSAKEKVEAEEYAQALATYEQNFDTCVFTMYLGAVQAESTGGLIHDVWYNTIYEKSNTKTDKYTKYQTNDYRHTAFNSDFNTSLSNLFKDEDFKAQVSEIETNQDKVALLMKDLKNPPEEYTDAYDALRDMYDAYCEITECAVNPSGNLTSYTSSFNTADSNFVKYYKAVELYQ